VHNQFLLLPGVDEASPRAGVRVGAVMRFLPAQQQHLRQRAGFVGRKPDLYPKVVKYMQLNKLAAERAG